MGARFSPVTKAVVNEEHNPLVVNTSADFDALINTCFYRKPFIPWPVRKMLLVRAMKLAGNTAAAFDDVRFYSNSLERIAAAVLTPCLILWGRNDQVLDVSGASILDEILAHSKLVLLDKTGHLPMLEDPATCATLIQDFVNGPDLAGSNSSS